jgi:hypothetical protein
MRLLYCVQFVNNQRLQGSDVWVLGAHRPSDVTHVTDITRSFV